MADFTAIAGVSRTLKKLLIERMEVDDPFSVTLAPPDVQVEGVSGRRVNLYLYQVLENGYLKNQDIPGRGHPGSYGHPPLSLDLYYLLTAYGSSETAEDGDEQAQLVLGAAMRVLHDNAVITEGTILDPRLQGEFEKIKITLQPLGLEDFSKVWTALPNASFRRSVAYQVSVVQIESQAERRFPRLVGEPKEAGPRVLVALIRSPQITEIRIVRQGDPDRRERPFPYIRVGDTLILLGRNFAGENSRVTLGSMDIAATIEDRRVELIVPDAPKLQPGPQTVRVTLDVLMDGKRRGGFASNVAVVMLVPRIDDVVRTDGTLTITGSRVFHETLESLALIGERVIPSDEYISKSPTEIKLDLPGGMAPGQHPVRVRVNGAESIDERSVIVP